MRHHRKPSEQFRYEAEGLQILRVDITEQVLLHVFLQQLVYIEADGVGLHTAGNDLVDAIECAAANEEDILRIDLYEFLFRMLSSALRRNQYIGSFEEL